MADTYGLFKLKVRIRGYRLGKRDSTSQNVAGDALQMYRNCRYKCAVDYYVHIWQNVDNLLLFTMRCNQLTVNNSQ